MVDGYELADVTRKGRPARFSLTRRDLQGVQTGVMYRQGTPVFNVWIEASKFSHVADCLRGISIVGMVEDPEPSAPAVDFMDEPRGLPL